MFNILETGCSFCFHFSASYKDDICEKILAMYENGLQWVFFWYLELGKCGFYCDACPTYLNGNCKGCIEEHTEGDFFLVIVLQKRGS